MPWPKTGTLAITSGSGAVTGTGTGFITAGVRVGDALWIDGVTRPYEITAVNSEISLTITPVFAGATVTAATYVVQPGTNLQPIAERVPAILELLTDIYEGGTKVGLPSGTASDLSLYASAYTAADQLAGVYFPAAGTTAFRAGAQDALTISPSGIVVPGGISGGAVAGPGMAGVLGQILSVGAFGLGGGTTELAGGFDLSTLTKTGFYHWRAAPSDGPTVPEQIYGAAGKISAGAMIHFDMTTTLAIQIGARATSDIGTPCLFYRFTRNVSGARFWEGWEYIATAQDAAFLQFKGTTTAPTATDPATLRGTLYFNTSDNTLRIHNGTSFLTVTAS